MTARGAAVAPADGGRLAVTGLDSDGVGDLAAEHGIALAELIPRHASLEQAYLDRTKDSVEYRAGSPAGEGRAAR